MKAGIVWHSISYVLTLCSSVVITKIFNYYYHYHDFYLTLILYSILAPLNALPFLIVHGKRKSFMQFNVYAYFFIPALLYAFETTLLSFTLNHMELGLYVIARTSYSIFNYVSYKYIMKRQLNKWYYVGVSLLLMSYAFIMMDYSAQNSRYGMIMFLLCLGTGLTTSIYNTLAELQLSKLSPENKLEYTLLNNVIFQMTSFVVNIPIGTVNLNYGNPLLSDWDFIVLSILSAIGLQAYSINKFFILNDPDVNGSMIVSSLDLVRRIVVNTVSYTVLHEPITLYNMISNVLLLLASAFLFYSSNNNESTVDSTLEGIILEDIRLESLELSVNKIKSELDNMIDTGLDDDNGQYVSEGSWTDDNNLEGIEMLPTGTTSDNARSILSSSLFGAHDLHKYAVIKDEDEDI